MCISPRVVKRPFEADPSLHDIMKSVFFGQHSIVATIENSFLFKNRFQHHCANSPGVVKSAVRSLSLAKQRFDSTQKPMGRLVLHWPAFLQTVVEISQERRGQEAGDRALAFLAYINEGILVQIGMLADAGDEGGQLCRSFDTEALACEEMSSTIMHFLTKIRCLFEDDQPACL